MPHTAQAKEPTIYFERLGGVIAPDTVTFTDATGAAVPFPATTTLAQVLSSNKILTLTPPATATATLESGVTVTVPFSAAINDVVITDANGNPPATIVAGQSFFPAAVFEAANQILS